LDTNKDTNKQTVTNTPTKLSKYIDVMRGHIVLLNILLHPQHPHSYAALFRPRQFTSNASIL